MVDSSNRQLEAGASGYRLAPSILSADFARLGESVAAIRNADYVHVDVMDGTFVPNISFGAAVMRSVRGVTEQTFDVHLMVEEPIRYLSDFAEAGADLITVHAEACRHLDRTIQAIHALGCKASVALNPATSPECVRYVLDQLDMVLVMSVNPGFGGQKFLPSALPKIAALSDMIQQQGLTGKIDIEVDGGVNLDNVQSVLDAGANVIVAGSAVYTGDIDANIASFKAVFEKQ
jgi:ribulose-phosphate 3-epimerase